MSGFTYNGIHSSTYNVEYIPGPEDKWFVGPEFDVYDTDVAWRNGGYYYGNKAKIREFTINCWYDQITTKQREQIRRWLGRETSGNLVLDDMPFVYWKVRPRKVVTGKLYNDNECGTGNLVYSGTFTVTFAAYEPFGYLTRKANDGTETDNATDYCDLINESGMPRLPTTSGRNFSVYNAGTEPCGLTIRISGTSTGTFRFYNTKNDTSCVFSDLPSGGLILDVDGDTGFVSTYISGADTSDNGFAYHDHGVVRLDPCQNIRGIPYSATKSGTMYIFTPSGIQVKENHVGGVLIFPGSISARINSVDVQNGTYTCSLISGDEPAMSGTMTLREYNFIYIQTKNSSGNWVSSASNPVLSSIEIDYKPRLL